jgi:hypothetical protein
MRPFIVLLLVASCTTTRVLRLPAETNEVTALNETLRDRPAKVVIEHQPEVSAVSVSLDTTTLRYQDTDGIHSVPLEAVAQIKYLAPGHPRVRGFFEGAGLGFLAGGIVGGIAGYAQGDDPCHSCFFYLSAGTKAFFGGAFGAIVGIIPGGIIGAAYGHRESLEPGPESAVDPPPQR